MKRSTLRELVGHQTMIICLVAFYSASYAQTFINAGPSLGVSASPMSINFGSGMSFYDFNNDGLDDLSFTMTNDSLRFYKNTGSGFELQPSFAYGDGESKHVLWVDYDNDGDLDFLLTINNGRYILYQNDSNLNFTDVSIQAGLAINNERHYGASFGDYDKDGYLDFYVCTYALDAGTNFLNANNHLYHNNGNGTFTDVTLAAGVADGVRLSFQSVWFDHDMDGWLDLFVINDRLYANSLYRNNGNGTFTNLAAAAGIEFPGQDPMTNSLADFDNDGDLDIYVTNTGLPAKQPKLLVNNSNGTYTDQALLHNVQVPHWTWGALWVDYNNDTFQDLYVATGEPSPLIPQQSNFFFANTGNSLFINSINIFTGNHIAMSHSLARGDFNNDGFYDIAALNRAPADIFLWENSGNSNNYVKITLHGTASNSFAISSYIKVFAGGNEFMQFTHCGENYLGQNSQHHIFGLANYQVVDSVQVIYLSGHSDIYYNLLVNQSYHFTEGDNIQVDITANGSLNICFGESVTMDAGEHISYLWNTGQTERYLTVTESGSYVVAVTNQFGVIKTDTAVVVVSPLPELLISQNNILCFGEETGSVLLQNLTGIEPLTVTWSNSGTGSELSELVAGTYSFVFTDLNDCVAEGDVVISEPDNLNIQIFSQPENLGNDGSILIFAGGGVAPYEYYFDGTLLSGPAANGLASSEYLIEIVDFNSCSIDSVFTLGNINSVRNHEKKNFKVFPNPAQRYVTIESDALQGSVSVSIADSKGVMLLEYRYSNNEIISIPLELNPGIYHLQIQIQSFIEYHKLVIH